MRFDQVVAYHEEFFVLDWFPVGRKKAIAFPQREMAGKAEVHIVGIGADDKRPYTACNRQLERDQNARDFGILRSLWTKPEILGFVW